MSLKILKAGILDTIQDGGRFGYQHLGINPNGVMDFLSAGTANALLGKNLSAPVIELHFPASEIMIEQPCVFCICGADFSPSINNQEIAMHQPIAVKPNSILSFKKRKSGARAYLALLQDVKMNEWLDSCSTNLKAEAGGFQGRKLQKNDRLHFKNIHLKMQQSVHPLPWKAAEIVKPASEISFLPGQEWELLDKDSQRNFLNESFCVSAASDRMGYRLQGQPLHTMETVQMISSPVSFGTVQLFPDGQLIVLMADHQTTGGYTRVAHVITADLPKLAQMNPGGQFQFTMTNIETAEEKLFQWKTYLDQLQTTCKLKMENFLDANN